LCRREAAIDTGRSKHLQASWFLKALKGACPTKDRSHRWLLNWSEVYDPAWATAAYVRSRNCSEGRVSLKSPTHRFARATCMMCSSRRRRQITSSTNKHRDMETERRP